MFAILFVSGFRLQVWSICKNVEEQVEEVIFAAEYLDKANPQANTERNFLVLFGYKKNKEN